MKKRHRAEKEAWVLEYIRANPPAVDVLNLKFVDAYIAEFQPAHRITMFGANKCRELGRLLSDMRGCGVLGRIRVGIARHDGMPSWAYIYSLPV